MADDGVSYESLKNRWQREVSTGPQELTRLDPSFYERVEAYLDELEEEYQREHEMDPTSGKAMLLRDELFNLRKILEDLYDQRERKVLLLALTAARGGNPDRTNMTDGEEQLFEAVVEALQEGRRRLLRRHDRDLGEEAKASPVPDEEPPRTPEEPLDAYDEGEDPAERPEEGPADPTPVAPEPEGGSPSAEEPSPEAAGGPGDGEAADDEAGGDAAGGAPAPPEGDRVVVRVTEEVPAFAASDRRTYDLEPEDVASLPANAAATLVDRDKAEVVSGDLDEE